jgi:formiminoglutamase
MADISLYFSPVELACADFEQEQLGSLIHRHSEGFFPELDQPGVAIFYVPEFRASDYGSSIASDHFRNEFYHLYRGINWNTTIYDLGTIQPGQRIEDTFHALANAAHELINRKIIPIIIGGSQDLTYALYKAYEKQEQLINICTLDAQLDLGDNEKSLTHNGWLHKIILHKPCYLFNYTNIGAQAHYISPRETELFEKLYFDILRFGPLSDQIELSEPILRNTDILSLDLTSIRSSDFRGSHYAQPNGMSAQEICRLARYAGISDKITSLGLFNYFPEGIETTSNKLLAQILWYFIEGIENRKGDFPVGSKKSYMKYTVTLEEENSQLIFLKSDKSGRWWMEVPYPATKGQRYERHTLIPCTYQDYQEAMKGMIPDLWWKTFQKLG